MSLLKELENEQEQGRNDDGTWTVTRSLEGGTDTLGYGHKLSRFEQQTGQIEYNGKTYPIDAVPNEVVEGLLKQDVAEARSAAQDVVARRYDKQSWDRMSDTNKLLAAELVFNTGEGNFAQFERFMDFATSPDPKDQKKAITEIGRTYKDSKTGERIQLSGRVQKIIDSLS